MNVNEILSSKNVSSGNQGELPIPKITPQNTELAKSIEDKVNQIFVVTSKETYDPKRDTEDNRRIKEIEYQIHQLVYKLYALTPEEIKIIEKSAKQKGG